jgi:phage baseplate assembly protein W
VGYRVISTTETGTANTATPTVLGISYKSADAIFTPIYTTTEQALENLKTLLLTRVGERYGYPQFGTHLLNVLFEPNVNELKTTIDDIITSKVSIFLPYITINEIKTITKEDDPAADHYVTITINFAVGNFDTRSIQLAVNDAGVLTVETI